MNSPIYSDPANPNPQGSVAQAAADYTGLYGVPAAQINMGTPFYGYWYRLQKTLYQLCLPCRNVNVPTENYGTFIKQNINQNGWIRQFNTVQQVPYLVKSNGNAGFITYDDADSTAARITYAVWTSGLGGSFMWSLDADYDGSTQDLLDAMYQATMGGAD
jgi:GH18 family chitinase